MDYFNYINEYIEYKNFKLESSKRMYLLALNLFKKYVNSKKINLFVDNNFESILEKFISSISNDYSSSSINSFIKVIINYFNYIEDKSNFTLVNKDNLTVDNNQISFDDIISEKELDKLLLYLQSIEDYRNMFLVYVAFFTGIKAKYLVKIKYSDFKYNKDGCFVYNNNIFKVSPFEIELPKVVANTYNLLLVDNIKKEDNAYIFVNSKNNVYTERYLRGVFKNICTLSKVKCYSPSSFRHSAVYYYIKNNGYIKEKVAMRFNWTRDNYNRMYKQLFSK